jgi:hypothetical protein
MKKLVASFAALVLLVGATAAFADNSKSVGPVPVELSIPSFCTLALDGQVVNPGFRFAAVSGVLTQNTASLTFGSSANFNYTVAANLTKPTLASGANHAPTDAPGTWSIKLDDGAGNTNTGASSASINEVAGTIVANNAAGGKVTVEVDDIGLSTLYGNYTNGSVVLTLSEQP